MAFDDAVEEGVAATTEDREVSCVLASKALVRAVMHVELLGRVAHLATEPGGPESY
jgi:hypothetical protein